MVVMVYMVIYEFITVPECLIHIHTLKSLLYYYKFRKPKNYTFAPL